MESGDLIRTLNGHAGYVYRLAFSENGTLASDSSDGSVNLWDVEGGGQVQTLNEGTRANAVAFYNASVLVSGSDDRLIKLWDTEIAQLIGTLAGHRSSVVSLAFCNETLLASGSDDFKLWTL